MSERTPPRRGPPPRAALPAGLWSREVRVRFSHCDPAGIVYFARYFDILNGVVEDWFDDALGLDYADFIGPRRIGLGYAGLESDFVSPGFMGDRLAMFLAIRRIGGASLSLAVHGYRGDDPILTVRPTIVTTSLVTYTTIPLPDDLRAALERYAADSADGSGSGDA